MAGNYKNTNELPVRNACFSSRAYSGASVPEQNAAAKVFTRDYEKDTAWHVGYFRGGEERTGGGILQTKQLPWGDAFAL